jgi:hypothetical protein
MGSSLLGFYDVETVTMKLMVYVYGILVMLSNSDNLSCKNAKISFLFLSNVFTDAFKV